MEARPPGSGSSWTSLGTLPVAVTDLGLDSGGGLWACAAGVYQLAGGVFTKIDIGTSWTPRKILLDGASPGWIATDGFIYERDAKGAYVEVGPAANAPALVANGRFFMAADPGHILSGHAP